MTQSFGFVSRLRQWFCRHQFIFHREGGTTQLECEKCLWVSPGWTPVCKVRTVPIDSVALLD